MDKLKTNADAWLIVEKEGLGYAVQHYCDGSYFKDPELGRLWDEAARALDAVSKYLEPYELTDC